MCFSIREMQTRNVELENNIKYLMQHCVNSSHQVLRNQKIPHTDNNFHNMRKTHPPPSFVPTRNQQVQFMENQHNPTITNGIQQNLYRNIGQTQPMPTLPSFFPHMNVAKN